MYDDKFYEVVFLINLKSVVVTTDMKKCSHENMGDSCTDFLPPQKGL